MGECWKFYIMNYYMSINVTSHANISSYKSIPSVNEGLEISQHIEHLTHCLWLGTFKSYILYDRAERTFSQWSMGKPQILTQEQTSMIWSQTPYDQHINPCWKKVNKLNFWVFLDMFQALVVTVLGSFLTFCDVIFGP